jgi:hypothetical protein
MDVSALEELFFRAPPSKRVVIVFHCEYSIQRAPQMALHFRGMDRHVNTTACMDSVTVDPHLFYPDVYILKGGYRNFYESQKVVVTYSAPL